MGTSQFSTLNELFLKAIERHNKPGAFLWKSSGRYQGLSSQEALRRVAALARALEGLGVKRGDRVAIISENRLEWALTDYAILGLGGITVPIYPTLLEPDVEFILQDSGSKGVVVSTETQLQKVLNVRSRLLELDFILAMECEKPEGAAALSWKDALEAELKSGADLASWFRSTALGVKPENTASIIYTSGTTGQHKGVVLTHANIASNVQGCRDLFHFGVHDVGMSFLPLSHIYERMLDYTYFWHGVSIAYAESFDKLPQNLLEARPTVMAVVPRVLEKMQEKVMEAVHRYSPAKQKLFHWALQVGKQYFSNQLEGRTPPLGLRLKHAVADALVFSKVRARLGGRITALFSGSAPLSRDLAEFFFAVGLPVYEGYGLTETSPVISGNYPGHFKLGTVGRVIPGVEVRLGEETEDEAGGFGREILVRGPNVAPGYYRLEEENRKAFADGWFHTGDLGNLDSDGYLTITGRKKNLFKTSGGKYVAPEKLENIFQGHPYIHQLVVIGEGRKFVAALIVPNFERLEAYARSRGLAFSSRDELIAIPEIQSFMQQKVDEATHWLPPHERIRQIVLLPSEFSISSGELSAKLSIKRRVVEEKYREQIEEMFRRRAPQPESSPVIP